MTDPVKSDAALKVVMTRNVYIALIASVFTAGGLVGVALMGLLS